MKFMVVTTELHDGELCYPQVWFFDSFKKAKDYAHRLCTDWVWEYDEDWGRELNEMYITENKYEADPVGCHIVFDNGLGHVVLDFDNSFVVRIVDVEKGDL